MQMLPKPVEIATTLPPPARFHVVGVRDVELGPYMKVTLSLFVNRAAISWECCLQDLGDEQEYIADALRTLVPDIDEHI